MAKFRNVGANPICLRGGRVINPNEEFTPGRYEAGPRVETNLATGKGTRFPAESGFESDDTMLAFLFEVGAIVEIAEEIAEVVPVKADRKARE